jgi:uncharacterized delta-60 repeat protein
MSLARRALSLSFLVFLIPAPTEGVRAGGPLDRSFGGDGTVVLPYGSIDFAVTDVAIDRDGRIVLTGMDDIDGDAAFTVARLTPSGRRDRSFGQDGVVKTGFRIDATEYPHDSDIPFAVAVQRDGKIVVAGQTSGPNTPLSVALARYMPGGALDDSFGDGGRVITDLTCNENVCGPENAADMLIQPDGRIVVVGVGYVGPTPSIGVMRYLPSGRLDDSFGKGGVTATALEYGVASAHAVALHRGGLVVAGTTTSEFVAVRYHEDGSLDRSFGSDGLTYEPVGADHQEPRGIAVDRNGRIVLAGFTKTGDNPDTYDYALMRLGPNGHLDETFSGDGTAQVDLSTDIFGRDEASDVVVQRDGKVIAVGVASRKRLDFGLVRFTARGRLDKSFGRKGKLKVDFGEKRADWAQAVVLDGNGRIVVAGGSAVPTGGFPLWRFAAVRLNI